MGEPTDRTDTERDLLEATERAIADHGVSAVTTQDIADEWGRAQSLVHYYYDTKADLVVAYVEYVRELLRAGYDDRSDDPPLDRLEWAAVVGSSRLDAPNAMTLALFELHSQAPHDDRLRDALNDLEDAAREFVEAAVADGIADGTFRDVDPAVAATMLLSAHDGGLLRTGTLARDADVDHLRAGAEQYVRNVLLTGDARDDWTGFSEGD